tara:strand:- start:181 stop:1023 length:843 start_codon:yes stop_codon:yes gene_type:complete
MSYGKIYETTWWGNPVTDGWGGVYAALSSDPTEFRFTIKTDNAGTSNNDQFTLPLDSSFSSITAKVDWGDGNTDDITTYNQSEVTHTYSSAGTYTIKITNALKGWRFNNSGDKLKMLDIENYGILDINTDKTFNGCNNLTQSATDAPTITTTTFASCFKDAGGFNGAVGNWNVSTVTNMAQMFRNTTAFDQDLSSWNIVNVSNGNNFLLGNNTLSTANYDALLIGWEATLQAAFSGGTGYSLTPTWRFGSAKYTDGGAASTARASLVSNFNWTIVDGGTA